MTFQFQLQYNNSSLYASLSVSFPIAMPLPLSVIIFQRNRFVGRDKIVYFLLDDWDCLEQMVLDSLISLGEFLQNEVLSIFHLSRYEASVIKES